MIVFQVKNAVNLLKEKKMSTDTDAIAKSLQNVLETAESVLGEWLDGVRGDQVTENSIFTDLPRRYEHEFNRDMEALNVRYSRSRTLCEDSAM